MLLSACTYLLSSQSVWINPFFLFGAVFAVHLLCQVGFVIGNPSGCRLEILGRKPLWNNGSSSVINILTNRPLLTTLSSRAPITVTASFGQPGFLNNVILYHDTSRPTSLLGTIGGTTAPIAVMAQMQLHSSATAQSIPERLELPFSSDDILSGYEDLVSSGSDRFTMWGKMSPHEVLAEHVVDIHKVMVDFRDAFERRQSSSSQTYGVNRYFSSQSHVQRRLSIYNWNPWPRRGREDAFEKQITENWHIVTLQEASDYVDHDILQERFHVTHLAGCAILFNKDTLYSDIDVKSIYLHDTRRDWPDQII